MPDYSVGYYLVAESDKDGSETILGFDPGLSLPIVGIAGYTVKRISGKKYHVGECPAERSIDELMQNDNQTNNLDSAFTMLDLISPLVPTANIWIFDNKSKEWKVVTKKPKEDVDEPCPGPKIYWGPITWNCFKFLVIACTFYVGLTSNTVMLLVIMLACLVVYQLIESIVNIKIWHS